MKYKATFIFLVLFLFQAQTILQAQINRVEPPFWWTGMKNQELQLMVYGENIAGTQVEISYDGIIVQSVTTIENPNYLFINLFLKKNVRPGKFSIQFLKNGKSKASYEYELKSREPESPNREGFNNSDVMYLIMPDRFANGDQSNDEVDGLVEGLNRAEPYGRHGGDIKGIVDHLDYIKDMGFTAIWLNPLLENNQPQWSYHGYATTDFYSVDGRFGTNEDYKKLGILAKEKGIKMIMDMIFNHCGSEHWWMKDIPSSDWINYYPDYVITNHHRTVNQDPYASDFDVDRMTRGWFVPAMPDMNLRNPFLKNYLIQNSIWWIEYVGLAGIRMDTYPYPDKYAMAKWNERVLEEYPNFNIVGEEWSMNPAIVSYWQKGQKNNDGYDGNIPSMMDFPLQNALSKSLNQDESWGEGLIVLYEALANDFLYPDPENLVIFPDNHDMPRFFMQLNMDVDLYKLGIAYILTTRGIPQIFYGSEVLMTHKEGNDHGVIRKDFPGGWKGDEINGFTRVGLSEQEKEMQEFFKTLLNWRKDNTVVQTGKLVHFAPQDGVYVYFRTDGNKKIMVVLNKNVKEYRLKLTRFNEMLNGISTGKDILSGKQFDLNDEILLPFKSPLILELN